MKTNCVITIGRQFGSGGRYVGRMLAEKLGIPFYDKELLSEAAKQSGICEEIFEDHDEKPTRSLLFNLVTGMQVHGDAGSYYMDMPLNHKIFLAQFDAIRSIADKGPCVIVGRCADYVLKDRPNTISVFLKAEMQSKVERAVKYYGVDPQKAEDRIRKADKQRASYYNYYATATWGDVNNYDLCVDTGKLGVEGMPPEVLLSALRAAGATFEGEGATVKENPVTHADLLDLGLIGAGSKAKRAALLRALALPEHLSTAALLDVLGTLTTREELVEECNKIVANRE